MAKAIVLGSEATDTVSGFTGIITAHCLYLNGDSRFLVTGKVNTDGDVPEHWFDSGQVTVADD
jgi:hypothetical protein